MLETLRTLHAMLTPAERRQALMVFLVMLGTAVLEAGGVASVMPFMAVLANPSVVQDNDFLRVLYEWSGSANVSAFLRLLGVAVFAVLMLSLALKATNQWVQLRFSQYRVHALGCRMMERYLGQPYHWFLTRHTSRIASTILGEINRVISGSLFPAMQMATQSLITVLLLGVLLAVDPFLAGSIALVVGLAYLLFYSLVRGPLARIGTRHFTANRARYRVTNETFGGIKDVKMAGLERVMLERFRGPSRAVVRQEIRSQTIAELPAFAMQALVFGGMLLILLYLMNVHGTIGDALPVFATFAFAGYRLMPAVQGIYRQAAKVRVAGPALQALLADLRELTPLPESGLDEATQELPPVRDAVELAGVHFRYPNADREALAGLELRIPARQSVGLVGATGSGKTTSVDVLLGLLEPDRGELRVDGVPVGPRDLRAWRRKIGYVPQHIYLADETVAANIAFGLPEGQIDAAAVERAARIANLHDFVLRELPDGYATRVGERGVRLSGGQRQRIGIARALYHDPEILVLDEATSALDNLTERAVMEAVERLSHRKTIVMIAHRLSTVRKCDKVVLLEQGRVVAEGSYEELIRSSASFRRLAEAS